MQILELLFGIFKKTSVLIHKLIPKQELLLQNNKCCCKLYFNGKNV